MTHRLPRLAAAASALFALATFFGGGGLAGANDDDDELRALDVMPSAPFRSAPAKMRMGATPGGAQDIDFARSRILAGEIPHPQAFTPEGLFSQHDLPLGIPTSCKNLLCLSGAAARVDLVAQPEARWLAQLEFASSLDPRTWKRAPLNLVAVVDKSGSMSGEPLETVKESLRQVAKLHDPGGSDLYRPLWRP